MKVTRTDGKGLPPLQVLPHHRSQVAELKAGLWPATWSFHDWWLHLTKAVTWKQRSETSLNLHLSFSRAA